MTSNTMVYNSDVKRANSKLQPRGFIVYIVHSCALRVSRLEICPCSAGMKEIHEKEPCSLP